MPGVNSGFSFTGCLPQRLPTMLRALCTPSPGGLYVGVHGDLKRIIGDPLQGSYKYNPMAYPKPWTSLLLMDQILHDYITVMPTVGVYRVMQGLDRFDASTSSLSLHQVPVEGLQLLPEVRIKNLPGRGARGLYRYVPKLCRLLYVSTSNMPRVVLRPS